MDPPSPELLRAKDADSPAVQSSSQPQQPSTSRSTQRWIRKAKDCASLVAVHTKHTGVGIVCAVAYFDPGNWGVDLQAGSQYGYKLLFVVLLSGIFAIFFQTQASRLGCVTGLDLASHCRLLLYDRPKHKSLYRWLLLYPLYVLSEIAIISTDLAELLGSAIALCMLFPSLPLWAGVVITASDVLLLLAFRDPIRGQPVRIFELFIAILVFTVLICMAYIISKAQPVWADAFRGYLPSKTLFQPALSIHVTSSFCHAIGIIGATVMPHSLFLGSALATQDRLSEAKPEKMLKSHATESTVSADSDLTTSSTSTQVTPPHGDSRPLLERFLAAARRHLRVLPRDALMDEPKSHAEREKTLTLSLLGLAVVINSLILILSSAVFFHGDTGTQDPASLFDAYDLLTRIVGKPAAILFALALLAAGQSSSIIATLAGQIVSEGFIRWRLSPMMRRLFTRCLGLVPALAVAAGLGRSGIDTLLVASQVVLSIVLPFVVFPLMWLTSSKTVMAIKRPAEQQYEIVHFSNGKISIVVGYAIWIVIVMANIYAIVGLARGEE
ncbi:Nramp-domain-containing protein [Epithele typhae]|uniref:Nramp-domain-containing protein n=1 Tax=Epithele typhae TaxID=378194 RepID=UPI002007A373|nr:Nramp-domain-containing protein [Epithele typhae]KAH9932100.1 Nramp-domain-containing protein [Epithele typhae]